VASYDHGGKYLQPVLAGAGVVLSSATTAPKQRRPARTARFMDNNYIYVRSGGSWRRAALSTF
jgi:hypothetical protein